MELVFKHKKWDKQLQTDERIWKELGGFTSVNNLNGMIKREQMKDRSERNYQRFYSAGDIFYAMTARSYYLQNIEDVQSIYSVYLAGRSAILERLFAVMYTKQGRKIFEEQRGIKRFDYGVLQMIAIGQPLPQCIQDIDNVYIQLLNRDVDRVKKHLENREDKENLGNLFGNQISETGWVDIQMILQGDQASLKKVWCRELKKTVKNQLTILK